jgi:hypothetical protein
LSFDIDLSFVIGNLSFNKFMSEAVLNNLDAQRTAAEEMRQAKAGGNPPSKGGIGGFKFFRKQDRRDFLARLKLFRKLKDGTNKI